MTEQTVMPMVRVAVLADSKVTDLALPTELPLRDILPAVQTLLVGNGDSAPLQQHTLAPIGGSPFSADATLDTVGVVDGDLLALQPVSPGPSAVGVVEDIADAAVIFSESRVRPWGPAYIQRGARLTAAVFVLAMTAVCVTHRVATGELAGLLGAAGLAVFAAVAALVVRARNAQGAVELSALALVPIASALMLALPSDAMAPNIMLAAAGVAAWSLITLILGGRAIAFFTAATVFGLGVLLAAAAAAVWQPSPVAIGCGLIVFALLVTVDAPQLSALCARFPLPVIPAPGDPTPSAPAVRLLADLPRRVRAADSHQTGFIAGAVLLSVLGSLAIIGPTGSPGPWGWYVVVAAAAGATLRARVWDSAPCKGWLLAHTHLLTVALLVGFTVTGSYVAALWAVAVLAGLAAVWLVAALNPRIAEPETYSLPIRRLVAFAAAAIDASLIPVMAYLVGIFSWVLNR